MQITIKGTYSIIKVESDLTSDEDVIKFKDFIQEIIDDGKYNIIFDFTNVRVINSNGIGKILLFYKKLKEYSGSIGFINLDPNVKELFEKLMFFNLFKEYASEADIEG